MDISKVSSLSSVVVEKENSEFIEVELRGELLEYIHLVTRKGLYENKQELLRDGVRRLKEGRERLENGIKKAIKEGREENGC